MFNEVFPYYLSIGMTYNQFWRDDPKIVKFYRKAEKLRTDRINQELWLQGMYVYEAICDASPIFNPFAKKGTRPMPYPTEPYNLNPEKDKTKEQAEVEERKMMEKARRVMDSFATKINSRRSKEVSKTDG